MYNSQNKKRLQIVLLVLIAVLTLGIGYASITAVNLIINGNATAAVLQENFKVYFTSSTITEGKGTVSIDEDDATIGYFDITGLSKEGDYAEATYTVLNNSNSIGANIELDVTNSNKEFFKVTETIADSQLHAGDTTTVTVKVEVIKTPLNSVSTVVTAKLISNPIDNASATGNSSVSVEPAPDPVSFSTDSWATVKAAVRSGNTSLYNIGDTKTITIDGSDYNVRIANKSTDSKCGNEDYSETACGFVLEFEDIIVNMKYGTTSTISYVGSSIYNYLNTTLYEKLPIDLQNVIIPTRVITGFGCDTGDNPCTSPYNNGNNYVTTDKLYLLSDVEVFGSDSYDTAASTTTQFDYYQNSQNNKLKKYNNADLVWWLRTVPSDDFEVFGVVYTTGGGSRGNEFYNVSNGVSPAFRIG